MGYRAFGQSEPDEELQRGFRTPGLRNGAAGFHHAYNKEQHEQRQPNGLHRAVDADNYIPDRAAFKFLRRLREELPDLRQFFVPCLQGVFEILYDPVITHIHSSFPTNRGRSCCRLPRAP